MSGRRGGGGGKEKLLEGIQKFPKTEKRNTHPAHFPQDFFHLILNCFLHSRAFLQYLPGAHVVYVYCMNYYLIG